MRCVRRDVCELKIQVDIRATFDDIVYMDRAFYSCLAVDGPVVLRGAAGEPQPDVQRVPQLEALQVPAGNVGKGCPGKLFLVCLATCKTRRCCCYGRQPESLNNAYARVPATLVILFQHRDRPSLPLPSWLQPKSPECTLN